MEDEDGKNKTKQNRPNVESEQKDITKEGEPKWLIEESE